MCISKYLNMRFEPKPESHGAALHFMYWLDDQYLK